MKNIKKIGIVIIPFILLALVGCQGPAGPMGPQGQKGDTGATGKQGPQGESGSSASDNADKCLSAGHNCDYFNARDVLIGTWETTDTNGAIGVVSQSQNIDNETAGHVIDFTFKLVPGQYYNGGRQEIIMTIVDKTYNANHPGDTSHNGEIDYLGQYFLNSHYGKLYPFMLGSEIIPPQKTNMDLYYGMNYLLNLQNKTIIKMKDKPFNINTDNPEAVFKKIS